MTTIVGLSNNDSGCNVLPTHCTSRPGSQQVFDESDDSIKLNVDAIVMPAVDA